MLIGADLVSLTGPSQDIIHEVFRCVKTAFLSRFYKLFRLVGLTDWMAREEQEE